MATDEARPTCTIQACLFDLDGVLVNSVPSHAAAWKATFDEFLAERAAAAGDPFLPFDIDADYVRYVDGMRRADGVRTFLRSRGLTLPEGDPDDPPGSPTVSGLGSRKQERLRAVVEAAGIEVYPGSLDFVRRMRADGRSTAVVSSSANATWIMQAAGIEHLFDATIDGGHAARHHLRGKPAPDMFLAAAAAVDTPPEHAAVYEDALVGVESGRAGRFGLVVGVDRRGGGEQLLRHGADIVVSDLAELLAAR